MVMMQRSLPLLALIISSLAVSAQAADLLDAPVSFSATRTVMVNGTNYVGPMFHVATLMETLATFLMWSPSVCRFDESTERSGQSTFLKCSSAVFHVLGMTGCLIQLSSKNTYRRLHHCRSRPSFGLPTI